MRFWVIYRRIFTYFFRYINWNACIQRKFERVLLDSLFEFRMTIDELYYCFFSFKAVGEVNAEKMKACIILFSFSFGMLDINEFFCIIVHKFGVDTSW